jgi:hypothetical protein
MPTNVPDPKPILCYRKAKRPGPDTVVVQQIVAYVV